MKKSTSIFSLITISIVVIFVCSLLGNTKITPDLFINFRLPRVLFGFFTGALLSIIGVIVQKIFNNRIATGQTLGITSASSAGATVAIFLSSVMGFYIPAWLLAIIFSLFCSFIIVALFNKFKSSSHTIVAGVSLSLLFSSLVLLLQYLTPYTETKSLMMFVTGSLTIYGYMPVLLVIFTTIFLMIFTLKNSSIIDALSIGKGFSLSRGINYSKEFSIALIVVSVALSISVCLCGPVMFVGLIIPNILYKMGVLSTKQKVIKSFFWGGIFITITDTLARSILSFELPIGIITGFLGSIFMIYILGKKD